MADKTPHEVEQLEVQMERGSMFAHASLETISTRVARLESTLSGLIDALTNQGSNGAAAEEETQEPVVEAAASESSTKIAWPSIALRADGDEVNGEPAYVDCAARMHVCHAVCCKLHFALSPAEVDGGKVKWDLGRPYFIRHDSDGYCTHIDKDDKSCGVYDNRPQVCRGYSCVGDDRIWKDFDNMVLNQEWIDEHIKEERRIMLPSPSIRMDVPFESMPEGS